MESSNDYPILPGKGRRSRSVDLAIVNQGQIIEVAAEFKYEPFHRRQDICRHKLPVVFWTGKSGVGKDVERVRDFIAAGKAKIAYAGQFWRKTFGRETTGSYAAWSTADQMIVTFRAFRDLSCVS